MSAGDMPLMRDACPSVRGFNLLSFCLASKLKEEIRE